LIFIEGTSASEGTGIGGIVQTQAVKTKARIAVEGEPEAAIFETAFPQAAAVFWETHG
jgi:hypothetical protein